MVRASRWRRGLELALGLWCRRRPVHRGQRAWRGHREHEPPGRCVLLGECG